MNSTTVPNPRGSTLKKSSFPVKGNDDSPFDKVNSMVSVAIYHQYDFRNSGNNRNLATHYMRWKQDKVLENTEQETDRFYIEFKRIPKLIEKKLNGQYANNRMKTINVYLNLNKGGSLVGEENDHLCTMVISPNYEYQTFIVGEESLDEEQINFFNTEMAKWQQEIELKRK